MSPMTFLTVAGVFMSLSLAVLVLVRDRGLLVNRVFAAAMGVLALERGLAFLSVQDFWTVNVLLTEFGRLAAAAVALNLWLVFSLIYGRESPRTFLKKWRTTLLLASLAPFLALVFWNHVFTGVHETDSSHYLIKLGIAGYLYHVVFLLNSVWILMNLERTLSASAGGSRWRVKFMILGLGSLFGCRIYTTSQFLLFYSIDTEILAIDTGALLLADVFALISLARSRLRNVNIYVSREFIGSSIVLLVVSTYLIVIGVIAQVAKYFGVGTELLRNAFFVFLACTGVVLLMLSHQLSYGVRRFVSFHFRRPRHDYRRVWYNFTERTYPLMDLKDVGAVTASIVSDVFGVSSVSVWIREVQSGRPKLLASTFPTQGASGREWEEQVSFLMLTLKEKGQKRTLDLDRSASRGSGKGPDTLSRPSVGGSATPRDIRYCVPLVAGNELTGVMTLGPPMTGEPFTVEDFDLLELMAVQTAGMFLNHRLFERLEEARQMEALQTVSAFFVHDLKNLASTLSITLENLPLHYDSPEFRKDILGIISRSVDRINFMCGQLADFKKTMELQLQFVDLNELVEATLSQLTLPESKSLSFDPGSLPKLSADPDQMGKIVTNLVINAVEATGEGGEIRVETSLSEGYAVVSVADNGPGMSPEFIRGSLFHPFKTTKKKGLGVGLFQCKKIAEAHGGWIEVESEEGKGTNFRVFLPVGE